MGIVYVLCCHTTNEKYVGSTMKSLQERYKRHKRDKSCVSRHIIARNNYSIKQLEVVETDDRIELEKREQYWMDIIPNINHKRAYISQDDRNKEKKEGWENWYSNNKQKQYIKAKKYREENYDKVVAGDRRRKAWRRSWKADGRCGFYNSLLDIDTTLFE